MIPQVRLTWAVTQLASPFSDDYMLSSWLERLFLSFYCVQEGFLLHVSSVLCGYISCSAYLCLSSFALFCSGSNVYCCKSRCLCWAVLGPWTYQTSWRPCSPNWTVQFCERSLSYRKRYSGQPNVGAAESKGSARVLMVCVPHGLGGWALMCPGKGYVRIPE